MIFNKRETNNCSFQIYGKDLEIVKSYNYLGLIITNSGNFKPAIKELTEKGKRAYFAMKSSFINTHINPRIYMKLFDTLIKPIALYGCEIWGAFGNKKVATVCSNLFDSDRLSYEQLHLKTCKNAIQIGKNASNISPKMNFGLLFQNDTWAPRSRSAKFQTNWILG